MINYQLLADSIDFYTGKGFQRIETPWTVSEYVDDITKPKDRPHYQLKHNNKCLVASGEQSFLYLYLKEYLPKGKFQTITPCFRYEAYDLYHEKCFMKNELIITDDVSEDSLKYVIDSAYDFFKSKLDERRLHVVPTDIGYDIEYNIGGVNPIELGSYGIRKCEFIKWIYGTGCAEPRLSKVMEYRNG
jgi:hypothetical protein